MTRLPQGQGDAPDEVAREEALPPQVPIGSAARAPVGSDSITVAAKVRETFTIIVAPLLIPAGILALARSGHDRSLMSGITLVDFAFAIVAVGFAAIARSLKEDSDVWRNVTLFGLIVIVVETALAISRDSFVNLEHIEEAASRCRVDCSATAFTDFIASLSDKSPSPIHWMFAVISALALLILVGIAIWREA